MLGFCLQIIKVSVWVKRLQQCHVWGFVAVLQRSALPDGDLEMEEAAEMSLPEGLKALMHK